MREIVFPFAAIVRRRLCSTGRADTLPYAAEPRGILVVSLCAFTLCVYASLAAADAGTVEYLSATLSMKGADGKIRILSRESVVRTGDTVNTQEDSYAVQVCRSRPRHPETEYHHAPRPVQVF